MKITHIGLSCFLIENKKGGKLLIDTFSDTPEHSLGLILPKKLTADLFLSSHADSDHANMNEKFATHRKKSNEKDDASRELFPNLDLRGTVAREWNGDLCIAFHFTIDGTRCLHLADNSHPLSKKQLTAIGKVDVLFLPMPKSLSANTNMELKIIRDLKPKIIIPAHTIPLPLKQIQQGHDYISKKLSRIILTNNANPHANQYTVEIFSHMLLAAENLTKHLPTITVRNPNLSITNLPQKPTIYYFEKCLAKTLK